MTANEYVIGASKQIAFTTKCDSGLEQIIRLSLVIRGLHHPVLTHIVCSQAL